MKNFFLKVKTWFKNHRPSKRRLIQVYAALLYNANIKGFIKGSIYTGNSKVMCVPGLNCYSCPGAVGACPLGALQNAIATSGKSAPYYVIGILAIFGIILGRTICGFLCPVGLGQELLYKIKTPKLKKNRVTRILSYFKYILLIVLVFVLPIFLQSPTFCKYICPAGTFGGAIGLLVNPGNADFFAMLSGLFTWKFALLVAIIVASIFIYRAFCRFLCPLGALYSFFNRIAFIGVKLDNTKCTDCGLCVAHCKMDIKHVGDHECIECGECIAVCPTQAITWKGSKIFLHPNAIEDNREEKQPALAAVLESGTAAEVSVKANTEVTENIVSNSVLQFDAESGSAKSNETEGRKHPSAVDKVKKRNRILEAVAWSVAAVFLIFVLVYYNFIVNDKEKSVYTLGDTFIDFTVQTYEGNETGEFTLSDERGKVVVLNFWATWCNPCVHELPYFNQLQEAYVETVTVVALHGTNVTEDVAAFINENWSEYTLTFAQDADMEIGGVIESLYTALGGKDVYPMTVILNGDGVIEYVRQGSITYNDLEKAVLNVVNK